MVPLQRKCSICNKMTTRWERTNGSYWYCYDGCYSTTGRDNRTENGKPLWEQDKKK